MITIKVKPRQDDLYDIYVGDPGDHFLNSDQGYSNVEDAVAIVHRCFPPAPSVDELAAQAQALKADIPRKYIEAILMMLAAEPVILLITYRDGTTRTEQLR